MKKFVRIDNGKRKEFGAIVWDVYELKSDGSTKWVSWDEFKKLELNIVFIPKTEV